MSDASGSLCPPGDFYIDPVRSVARAIITHDHSDHTRSGQGAVLATPDRRLMKICSRGWKSAVKNLRPMRRRFRPAMLAQAIDEETDFAKLDPANYAAEWKWDGIRVQQAVNERDKRCLYTRTADDISHSFSDVLEAMNFEGAIDGELLVMRDNRVAPFGDLQQRLNRKTPDAELLAKYPAFIRAYDLLLDGETDIRHLPFRQRRGRLELFVGNAASPRVDLSPALFRISTNRTNPSKLGTDGGWRPLSLPPTRGTHRLFCNR